MASYRIVSIPLDAPFNHKEIQQPGQRVPDVGIIFLPSSAVGNVFLHIGAQADPIPLYLMGQNMHSVPSENAGIYLTNSVAQVGQILQLLIGYEVNVDTQRTS